LEVVELAAQPEILARQVRQAATTRSPDSVTAAVVEVKARLA
jgi:hypothetical protein